MPLPKKGVAYSFNRVLFSNAAPGSFQVNPTIAVGDFQISKDEGAFTNVATLPVVAPVGSQQVHFVFSATEMTADRIDLRGVDQVGGEWTDFYEHIDTTTQTVDDLPTAAQVAAAVWATLVETGVTAVNAMKLIAAACFGKGSGLATTTAVYTSGDLSGSTVVGTKNRITATVDAVGNRSVVNVDLT